MSLPRITSRENWLEARKELLEKEKALTRERDALNVERRNMPMVKIEKDYRFEGPDGAVTLLDMFEDRSQLIVGHFMFNPEWEDGCPSCSAGAAELSDGLLEHLRIRDTSFAYVSRAPIDKIQRYQGKRGWDFAWYSSYGSDFNYDFHVSFTKEALATGKIYYNYAMVEDGFDELPGLSVFYRNEAGEVFHTYSSYARGNEEAIGTFIYLDITPKGRNEVEIMDWVKRHDEYGSVAGSASCCGSEQAARDAAA
jgi:predicted dithiol-disulfide oxidoreductase (DUF899 family)